MDLELRQPLVKQLRSTQLQSLLVVQALSRFQIFLLQLEAKLQLASLR